MPDNNINQVRAPTNSECHSKPLRQHQPEPSQIHPRGEEYQRPTEKPRSRGQSPKGWKWWGSLKRSFSEIYKMTLISANDENPLKTAFYRFSDTIWIFALERLPIFEKSDCPTGHRRGTPCIRRSSSSSERASHITEVPSQGNYLIKSKAT